jgi:antitoxin component YwqK of YwqJK toxin-antitoxin module
MEDMKFTINGREVSETEWDQIKEDGIYIEYNGDGSIFHEAIAQGKKFSSRYFDKNGRLEITRKWIDNDNMIEKRYHKNGAMTITEILVNGELRLDIMKSNKEEREFAQLIIFGEV